MKKIVGIVIILLIVIMGCIPNVKIANKSYNDTIQNCLYNYSEFLRGNISVKDNNDMIEISDIYSLEENYNRYTLFDSNKNGIPELHLSSMREYKIIECDEDTLQTIFSGSGYDTLLDNGAILYTRSGSGPEHVCYTYTELDEDNIITQITFDKYNTMNNILDDDLYLFEGEEVTKEAFEEKTKNYLNVGSDMIIWSDYWTFLVQNHN